MEQNTGTRFERAGKLIGAALLLGFDDLGTFEGVTVEARELRDDKGGHALGALVSVAQDQYTSVNAFIDEDELPELLEAFRRFIKVEKNPTQFRFYEMTYETRGGLRIAVFNDRNDNRHFYVASGHSRKIVNKYAFERVGGALVTAQKKINAISAAIAQNKQDNHAPIHELPASE